MARSMPRTAGRLPYDLARPRTSTASPLPPCEPDDGAASRSRASPPAGSSLPAGSPSEEAAASPGIVIAVALKQFRASLTAGVLTSPSAAGLRRASSDRGLHTQPATLPPPQPLQPGDERLKRSVLASSGAGNRRGKAGRPQLPTIETKYFARIA